MPVFGQLIKIDSKPLRWRWTINGLDVELTSGQLQNYRLLQIKFFRHGSHTYPDSIRGVSWLPLTTGQWRDPRLHWSVVIIRGWIETVSRRSIVVTGSEMAARIIP